MADNVMTIQQYLSGKVRNISVPDDVVATIIMDAGVTPKVVGDVDEIVSKDTDVTTLTTRERELCLAWLYVWVAGSPTQTGSTTDEDADWKHTEGGERMSANVLNRYLLMANDIFDKYDLPTVGEDNWDFVGRGICDPKIYNPVRTK